MKIENLDIKGFGKFNNVSFEFKEGLNVIYGNNEAGKTTLQMFIRSMLYGIKGGRQSKDGTPSMQKKYKPWIGDNYAGSLLYSLDNNEYYRVERNFNTGSVKIYDSHFNDITGSFETKKDKGVLFAERHLGLNENCFNKTVFIKQLDIKVDSDEAGELQNKLINIAQSGFEDVSYSKARSALIEASKNYVGTGKTTTRPLDILNSRLTFLEERYTTLENKRACLLDTEKALNQALSDMDILNKKRQLLQNQKSILNKKMYMDQLDKNISGMNALLDEIKVKEAEQSRTLVELEEISSKVDKTNPFAQLENENVDDISIMYYRYNDMLEQEKKLLEQIASARASIDAVTLRLEEMKCLSGIGKDDMTNVSKARRELDGLLEEQKRSIPSGGKSTSNSASLKPGSLTACIAATLCLSTVSASAAFTGILPYRYPLLTIAILGAISTCILIFKRNKLARKLKQLEEDNKAAFIYNNALIDKIKTNKKIIDDFLSTSGFNHLEDFYDAKHKYDADIQEHVNLNFDINRLECENINNKRRMSELKNSLLQILEAADVISHTSELPGADSAYIEAEINESQIKAFNRALKEYRDVRPRHSYLKQRSCDLAKDIEVLYKKIAANYSISCSNSTELQNKIDELKNEALQLKTTDSKDECAAGLELYQTQSLVQTIDTHLGNTNVIGDNINIEADYEALCEDINNLRLKINEYELILKDSLNENDELQKLEEEMNYLKIKKDRLESINFSLKTALDILDEASAEIQHSYSPQLNKSMSRCAKSITTGKYTDIRADDNLLLNVVAPETGEVVNISCLSGGAIDQLYLSLRLSMANLMSGNGEKLPLMLDEIFSQYDDARTESTLEFMKEQFTGNQLLLFTCKSREIDLATRVFQENLNIINL